VGEGSRAISTFEGPAGRQTGPGCAPGPGRARQADLQTRVLGELVVLTPQRAVFWPARATLILADLHLGKSNTLRAAGLRLPAGVPPAMLAAQLDELESVVTRTGASRVLVVGDLLHAPAGLEPALIHVVGTRLKAWRHGRGLRIELVPGNHDRRLDRVADAWGLTIHDADLVEPPFRFVHDPQAVREPSPAEDNASPVFAWCGHVHPVVRVESAADSLRLPCYLLTPTLGLLPAFSRFTAGAPIRPGPADRFYAIADDQVIPLHPSSQ
jgi:hypothetical protein